MKKGKAEPLKAIVFSASQPGEAQLQTLKEALSGKYGEDLTIQWQADESIRGGFRLRVGDVEYDWTADRRLKQLEERWQQLASSVGGPVPDLQELQENLMQLRDGNPDDDRSVAVIRCAEEPTESQLRTLMDALKPQYGDDLSFAWQEDESIQKGFRILIDGKEFDWTEERRLRELEERWKQLNAQTGEKLISLMQDSLQSWAPSAEAEELGRVVRTGDSIAVVSGLPKVAYGEVLLFAKGIRGMVQGLRKNQVDCILFGDDRVIAEGSIVRRTGRVAGIPVGDGVLGRVVNAMGEPIDGKGEIIASGYRPVETPAPGILDRQPVNTPMETGLISIDSMFPIGRGQRELIIGDRQTGKTAIALDTILNQKGKNVVCIYVAIGQKASSVAQLAETLRKNGAMEYTTIVCATAGDAAPLQYIAPYAGCALGEHFMYQGRDVLIIYDDLSKHATAYRTLSLLLERAPGREAYPGDVFYIHSRLLERAAHLSDEKGGGSMTALPIVETQAGDVSAYIPTNVISITDGQIFLESNLFFSGQRPAVNVGLSVSRVGGAAQAPIMKSSVGSLRLGLASYREMAAFSQFSSDLDESTRDTLEYGERLMRLLRQPQSHPMNRHTQVIMLICAIDRLFQKVEVEAVNAEAKRLVELVERERGDICRKIDEQGNLTDAEVAEIKRLTREAMASVG